MIPAIRVAVNSRRDSGVTGDSVTALGSLITAIGLPLWLPASGVHTMSGTGTKAIVCR
jgi:hypothetical protein